MREVMMQAVMSLCEESTTKIKVKSGYSHEFTARVDVYQKSVLRLFLCDCD